MGNGDGVGSGEPVLCLTNEHTHTHNTHARTHTHTHLTHCTQNGTPDTSMTAPLYPWSDFTGGMVLCGVGEVNV